MPKKPMTEEPVLIAAEGLRRFILEMAAACDDSPCLAFLTDVSEAIDAGCDEHAQ